MPVVEAGLAGIPVVCTDVPAAVEIARHTALIFDKSQPPEKTAEQIIHLLANNPLARLRRDVRQNYTWQAIFQRQIEPLLRGRRQ